MVYQVVVSREAREDLTHLTAGQRARVTAALRRYLRDQPDVPSAIRRRLAPNPVGAPWELRLGELRVFYDVDADTQTVGVVRVGTKPREQLYLRGRPVEMRLP